MTTSITKSVARKFVTAHNRVDKALATVDTHRITAAGVVASILEDAPRGSAARLAELSGVAPGTISKYSALATALALVPDASDDDKRALARSLFDGKGNRAEVVAAVKAGNGAEAIAAANDDESKGTKATKAKDKSKGQTLALKDMSGEDLISLMGDALEALAGREDVATHGVALEKFAKSATVIAKNVMRMSVTV